MTVFAAALSALFSNQNLSAAATYISSKTGVKYIRVMLTRPDVVEGFGNSQFHAETVSFDILVSDVDSPEAGDVIMVGSEERIVQGKPQRDRERLVWTVDTRPK